MAIIINALKNISTLVCAAFEAAWSAAAVVAIPGEIECGNEETWYEAMQSSWSVGEIFGAERGCEEPWYGTFVDDPTLSCDEPSYDCSMMSYEQWEMLISISEIEPICNDEEDTYENVYFEPNTWEDYDILPKHDNAHLWASGFKERVDQTRSRASRASALARRRGRLMKRCR